MQGMWTRERSVWRFRPLPCVTVEPVMTSRGPGWAAYQSGRVMQQIRASRNSNTVKRAVWEYFDRRVEL